LDLFCHAILLLLPPLPGTTGVLRIHPVDAQIVNCAGLVSKWVGDTPKNIDALFQEARATDAVLCFDEAEGSLAPAPVTWAAPQTDMLPWMLVSTPHSIKCDMKRKEKEEKTTPFGVNLMRSQVLYRAAQEM